jgi:hypothetical protein
MSIIETPTGWTFTQGSTTYGPYATREEACERAYDLERGKAPGGALTQDEIEDAVVTWIAKAIERHAPASAADSLAADRSLGTVPNDRGYWSKPLGTIVGRPVEGHYYEHTLYSAAMEWRGLRLTTDGTDYLNLGIGDIPIGETGESLGDLSMTEWASIKALAQTDIVEQLVALALVHATAEPPSRQEARQPAA